MAVRRTPPKVRTAHADGSLGNPTIDRATSTAAWRSAPVVAQSPGLFSRNSLTRVLSPMHRSFSPLVPALTAAGLCLPAFAQKDLSPTAAAKSAMLASPAWQELLEQAPGEWRVDWCNATGTPRAIWGTGIPLTNWRENSLAEARRHANQLLRDRAALLGLGTSEFREVIGARMSRVWTFTFDQFFRGLPVIGGRADVRVHMAGRVSMFGSMAWQIPADFGVTPAIDAETATAIAWQRQGELPTGAPQPAPVAAPRLVIWGDVSAAEVQRPVLAWEIAISNVAADGKGTIGRWYVDARTGATLSFTNDKHECGFGCTNAVHGASAPMPVGPDGAVMLPVNTTVTVQGWTRTGIDAFSALTNAPLPGLVLNVPGIGNVTTDNNGQFVINIAAAVNISVGALDGRHHGVIAGTSAPSGSFTVSPGVATTIQLLTPAATVNQAAHTTTSYWCDKVNEYARSILGNSAELATADAVVPTVNIAQTCNAFYTGNTINFYQAGGGCSNTANATVIAHEWGHGLDDRYGGISQTNGLSEGWGDILGMYLVDSPLLGSGFQTAGVPLRDGNNTTQYPCSGCAVHTAGQSWMGFAWKLRDRLATTLASRPTAIAITNDIVVGTIAADAVDQQGAVLEVFLADDNDGNLANGTPHSPDLIWACQQHSLPFPNMPALPNNECSGALPLQNGLNGPFTSVGSSTSSPAWTCATGGNDVWFTYLAGGAGTLTISTCSQAGFDTAIQVFSGSCGALTSIGCLDDSCSVQTSLSVPVTFGTYYIRVGGYQGATGTFSLNVSGPQGTAAASVPYGTACGLASRAFYETFATAAAFDLANSNMRLVRTGTYYVAQPGGSYVTPPGSATSLALTDDSVASVTLSSAFPYIGGTTTSLEVCSNGYVSVATGNGTGYDPSAAVWLGSPQTRWGTLHDFNPTILGSGAVKFHEAGSVSYVTWDGVFSYNTTTGGNTFQLQFDRSNGNVTFAWQAMAGTGNGFLVGYTAGGTNVDPGNRDISATLPGTFRNSADNAQPLALASTLPQLGTTLTFTTTNFPASSLLGIQELGLTHIEPGIDLGFLNMPGCFQYASLDVLYVMFPISQTGLYAMSVPNNPALQGFQMSAQSVAFVNGVNAAGLVTSNGLQITVGL